MLVWTFQMTTLWTRHMTNVNRRDKPVARDVACVYVKRMKITETQAQRIISKFQGVYPLKRALNHTHHTTVLGWQKRGTIPQIHHPQIWAAAQQLGIKLSPEDFLVPGVGPAPTIIDKIKKAVAA